MAVSQLEKRDLSKMVATNTNSNFSDTGGNMAVLLARVQETVGPAFVARKEGELQQRPGDKCDQLRRIEKRLIDRQASSRASHHSRLSSRSGRTGTGQSQHRLPLSKRHH